MLIYDVLHKEKVYRSVANDLRNLGVKHRLKKNVIKNENNDGNNVNNTANSNKQMSRINSDGGSRKVFKVSLSHQRLDVVNLSSGGIVEVPVFISQASAYLEKFLHQEGLFRKAGSQVRQKELIARLDNGGSLGDKNHAIDVANCLKTFFRNLPEPLIPYAYHDLFVRCLVLRSRRVEALMLACILLPPHHLNTLAFFMDFLNKVSLCESLNKMGSDNLATVVAPNIMPLQGTTMSAVQTRLEAHLVIVKILIENAKDIGRLPEHISEETAVEVIGSIETELDHSDLMSRTRNNKKKKHRSGSLTRMLNGLRKMVGKSGSPGQVVQSNNQLASTELISLRAPSMKHGKKRKVVELTAPVGVKKKRDILDAMPGERTNHHSQTLLASPVSSNPNPIRETSPSHKSKVRKYTTHKLHSQVRVFEKVEKPKKLRMSLDRFVSRSKQKVADMETENGCNECYSPCIERRWSSASSSSAKKKNREIGSATFVEKTSTSPIMRKATTLVNVRDDYDRIFMEADVNLSDDAAGDQINPHRQVQTANSDIRSMTMKNRCGNNSRPSLDASLMSAMTSDTTTYRSTDTYVDENDKKEEKKIHSSSRRVTSSNEFFSKPTSILNKENSLVGEKNSGCEEYVRIPKSEYEEIKSRVSAIESQISQELRTSIIANETDVIGRRHSVRKVQSEYEKILGEASIESTINAHNLAKRLSKELKIRRSSENKIIRSPSARKIGILRRRSQEKLPSRRVIGPPDASWNSEKIASMNRRSGSSSSSSSNNNKNNDVLQLPKRFRERNYIYDDDDDNVESRIDSLCSDETNARLNYLQEQLHTLITHTAEHTRGTFSDNDDDDGIFVTPKKLAPQVRRASSFHGNEFIDNSRYFNDRVKELKKTNSQQSIAMKCCDQNKEARVSNDDVTKTKTLSWKDAAGYFNSEISSNSALTPVPQTGRASIAKLRTQNAGMVLAKAKLFDDNDAKKMSNDSGIEKKIQGNESMRGTGRAPRLRQLSMNLENESSPSRKSSPITRRKHCKSPKNNNGKLKLPSPNHSSLIKMELTIVPSQQISKQQTIDIKRATASRGSNKFERENRDEDNSMVHKKEKILKSPSYGQTLPIGTYFHESNVNIYNPDVNASCKTPHIKRSLAIKTPKSARSLARRPSAVDTRRTPLKAVPAITTPKRQSPRNVLKSRQLSKPMN